MASAAPDDDRNTALTNALALIALGDRKALAALYKHVSAHLLGVILRIQRDRALAEDVLQDIFVSIWRNAQGYDAARSQPMTWLTSIARNRAIDSLRRRKTEVATVTAHGDDDDDTNLVDALPSEDSSPMELMEQAAQQRAVTHCIGALSAEQQQCVALAYYQGLSHSEVAQHLQQPLGTVKSWVRRALMALKDCLGSASTSPPSSLRSLPPEGAPVPFGRPSGH
jgi:RNA polymerase sigma-70 factor, ECF subfamily